MDFMKINDLSDFNSLRTAPILNKTDSLRVINLIDKKIINCDWLTIGIMAHSDIEAKEALSSIIRRYDYKFFKNFNQISVNGNVFKSQSKDW